MERVWERSRTAQVRVGYIDNDGHSLLGSGMDDGPYRDLALLSRVAVAANEAATTTEATDEIVAMLARHVQWPAATAWLRDRGDGVLRSSGSWYRESDPELGPLCAAVDAQLLVAPGSLPARVGMTGAPEWISDVHATDVFRDGRDTGDATGTETGATSEEGRMGWLSGQLDAGADRDLGIRSAFAVPVWYRTDVVGVIGMFSPAPRQRDDAVLELVEQVATQLGCLVGRTTRFSAPVHTLFSDNLAERRVLLAAVEQMWQSLAGIAHEVRTPLNGVLGSLELLVESDVFGDDPDGHGRDLAENALDAARRLHLMIEERLTLAEADLLQRTRGTDAPEPR